MVWLVAYEQKPVQDSIAISGIWRTFENLVPQYPAENPRLILVLYDTGMTTKFRQTVTGHECNRLAYMNENSLFVCPQVHHNSWNDYRRETSTEVKKKNCNGVDFIKSIVQRMEIRGFSKGS